MCVCEYMYMYLTSCEAIGVVPISKPAKCSFHPLELELCTSAQNGCKTRRFSDNDPFPPCFEVLWSLKMKGSENC